MSNPFLALAIGGLKGAQQNRRQKELDEERTRRHAREDLEEKAFLAQLAENPDVAISTGLPHLDAATAAAGGPAGAGVPPAPPTGLPPMPPAPPAPPHLPGEVGLPTDELGPVGGGGAGPSARAAGPPIAPPRPGPGDLGGVTTPHLDEALDLGSVDIGGQKVGFKVRAGGKQARETASQKAAFQTLQDRYGKHDYPAFIDEFDYRKELGVAAEEERRGEREARVAGIRARHTGAAASTAAAARQRVQLAEDIAYDAFEQGKGLEEVQALVARDPTARGGLSQARARSIQRDAARAAPDVEQSRRRVQTQLGNPPRPFSVGAPISDDVREAVIDALAHGHTGEEVLGAIKDPKVAHTVRRWLSKKGQASRQPPASAVP